jgi:hypothetical protein
MTPFRTPKVVFRKKDWTQWHPVKQDCQIFLLQLTNKEKNIPTSQELYRNALKYMYQMPYHIPNGHKLYQYQHLPLQDSLKFTQIRIFG